MEVLNIFEDKFQEIIGKNVTSVLLEGNDNVAAESPKTQWLPERNTSMACSYCRVEFNHVSQQRDHYKLDWHRYNLRQSLLQKQPITEDEFDEKTTKDDISSISGSDSENEDTLETYATAQGRIFLQNDTGCVFSLYACVLFKKKEEIDDLSSRLQQCCVTNKKLAVLMLGGGHFAGAVFEGDQPILHKTFHCYTVRAGQGGGQSSRDNKTGGSQPKSAGASLRRYNEQALVQHVKGIVDTWKGELDSCSLVIYRAPGPYNRAVLFGGPTPLFDKADNRLRTVPFSTRRATFKEVKRIHGMLTTALVYGSLESAIEEYSRQKIPDQGKRTKGRASCIDRAKSRETVERPLPIQLESTSEDEDAYELLADNQEVSFEDSLQEFGDSLSPEERKVIARKKKKPKKSKAKKLKEQEEQSKREITEVLTKGDVDKLSCMLDSYLKLDDSKTKDFVDAVLDDEGNTLLHVAAMNDQDKAVSFLLKNEANPCLRNKKQQTPYTCSQNKEIREIFKEYARENPEKYNYNKAQIPTNVLTPEEASEKRKAQRKVKKEKEKEKRKENETKRKEEAEKQRFLKLSDREKRALAAERRILSQSGTVISRCFLCAGDMTAQVPFEYSGNRFCSVECLKAHRMKHVVILS